MRKKTKVRWVAWVAAESALVVTFDFESVVEMMAAWVKPPEVRGAIVRVRVRVRPGETIDPATTRRALVEKDGAIAAHVIAEPAPEARKERVEGISSIPSERGRMHAYLVSRELQGTPVETEVKRIMEDCLEA